MTSSTASRPSSNVGHPAGFVEGQKHHLLKLPAEILDLIISYIFPEYIRDIEISVQRRIPGLTWGNKWRGWHEPEFYQLGALVNCSKESRNAVLQRFERYNCFYSDNTEGLLRLPRRLCVSKLALIRKFEVRMDDFTKNNDEVVFPELFQVLCTNLPNLTNLKLRSSCSPVGTNAPFRDRRDKPGSVTRQQQDARAILRFMAFLVKFHPHLRRIILPAEFEPTYGSVTNRSGSYLIADAGQEISWGYWEFVDGVRKPAMMTCEYEILNATAISRLEWHQLAHIDLQDFVIKPPLGKSKHDILDSNIPETNGYYAMVDERGYLSKADHQARGWKYRGVDSLIRACREVERKTSSIEGQKILVREALEKSDKEHQLLMQSKAQNPVSGLSSRCNHNGLHCKGGKRIV